MKTRRCLGIEVDIFDSAECLFVVSQEDVNTQQSNKAEVSQLEVEWMSTEVIRHVVRIPWTSIQLPTFKENKKESKKEELTSFAHRGQLRVDLRLGHHRIQNIQHRIQIPHLNINTQHSDTIKEEKEGRGRTSLSICMSSSTSSCPRLFGLHLYWQKLWNYNQSIKQSIHWQIDMGNGLLDTRTRPRCPRARSWADSERQGPGCRANTRTTPGSSDTSWNDAPAKDRAAIPLLTFKYFQHRTIHSSTFHLTWILP